MDNRRLWTTRPARHAPRDAPAHPRWLTTGRAEVPRGRRPARRLLPARPGRGDRAPAGSNGLQARAAGAVLSSGRRVVPRRGRARGPTSAGRGGFLRGVGLPLRGGGDGVGAPAMPTTRRSSGAGTSAGLLGMLAVVSSTDRRGGASPSRGGGRRRSDRPGGERRQESAPRGTGGARWPAPAPGMGRPPPGGRDGGRQGSAPGGRAEPVRHRRTSLLYPAREPRCAESARALNHYDLPAPMLST